MRSVGTRRDCCHFSCSTTRALLRAFFVWDNFSDDGSRQLIEACPNAVLMSYDSGGEYSERILQRLKNNCWKWSTADWVIVCDVDELVYHPHLLQYLEEQR